MAGRDESDGGNGRIGGTLDEYSVGPLDNSTWLVIYEMVSRACSDAPDVLQDEYREAKDEFLAAHPDEATGSPENWPESMREAWNEMVLKEIEDV